MIDISKYLKGFDSIGLYKCCETGYRFYYPFDICGDSEFYSQLERNNWYYMEAKWEHDEALKNIKVGDRVLEIGAGRGSFLQKAIGIEKVRCVGLELNQSAAASAKARGIDVLVETSEQHAKNHVNEYDIICLFQVLEHVPNPGSLLNSVMRMLKLDGRLIIGVPDNSVRATTSIFNKENDLLNMPPHHMGLWDMISLAALTKIYPIHLECLMIEPAAATYQKHAYRGLIKGDLREKYGILGFAYYLAIRSVLTNAIDQLARYLPAHTILASYIRRD